MTLRQAWFRLHWLLGITAGSALVVIGLSGATLAFREEILDLLNPGTATVPVRPGAAPLDPGQLLQALQAQALAGDAGGTAGAASRPVSALALSAVPGRSVRVTFAPPPGARRGESRQADPYTGALLPPRAGMEFFEWAERLHRWLLLPRDDGKPVTGALAACLLLLSLSGLYLRWPRRPLDWRTWLLLDASRTGRPFLWSLHAVLGTWALALYLVASSTGIYWAFDGVRDAVSAWAGEPRPLRAARMAPAGRAAPAGRDTDGAAGPAGMAGPAEAAVAPAEVSRAWAVFLREAGPYASASLRLPARPGAALQFQWLGPDAPHERARNRLSVQPATGRVTEDDRHAARPAGGRFLAAIHPLHMGSYFGLPGRIAMALAALALPGFAATGWMLYLDRRRSARAVRDERARFVALAPPAGRADGDPPPPDTVLVAHASQSGRAERIALQTAEALQAAGVPVVVRPLAALDLEQLRHWRRMLCVASTFGDGDPPDGARRFARQLAGARGPLLPQLSCGLLALGDRHYANFCGFGHALDHGLRGLGAQALFPMVEADDGDPAALARWSRRLAPLAGCALQFAQGAQPAPAAPPAAWRLARRTLCNPGSEGGPLYAVDLVAAGGGEGAAPGDPAAAGWRPGALAEVWPRQPAEQVGLALQRAGFDGATTVRFGGAACTLAEALARSALPAPAPEGADAAPQALADRLVPLAPRRYSVASVPEDGLLRLLVRQVRHDGGLGLASGWLTAHAPLDGPMALRLLDNPGFAPEAGDAPCLFVGNGAGFAGLRGQLQDRARRGRRRNWLLLGERRQAHDDIAAADIARWQAAGILARVDRVFSRDQPERRYVQDRLRDEAGTVRRWVADGAAVYVCGSLDGMAGGVDDALRDILGADGLDDLVAAGRYRRDVY